MFEIDPNVYSFPFDSISATNPDRAANSEALSNYLKAFFTNGVFPVLVQFPEFDQLNPAPLPAPGMGVQIGTGAALIDGKIYGQKITRTFGFDAASLSLARIDRIVVRKNNNLDYRNNEIYVVKGTESQSPVPPTLTRNNVVYELSICRVNIPAGTTQITAENIVDERADVSVCGYVTQTLGQVDTSAINARFQDFYNRVAAEIDAWNVAYTNDMGQFKEEQKNLFNNWFGYLQDQLSGDVAGNLQNNKVNIIVAESDVPLSLRKPKTFYFMISDRSQVYDTTIEVSPNMGIKAK